MSVLYEPCEVSGDFSSTVMPSMMVSSPVGPSFPQGLLTSALWSLPMFPLHKAALEQTTTNGLFTSAHLARLGVPGGHQNLADASALLKSLAGAIMALLPFPERVEVLLGCLSLGLGLPGLSFLSLLAQHCPAAFCQVDFIL